MKIIRNRVFKALIIIFSIGVLLGIISYYIVDDMSINGIKANLISYIESIKNNEFNYSNSIITSIANNLKYITIIWVSGIIFILIFIVPFIILFKGILFSFSLFNIINAFGIKGLLYGLIIAFPSGIINLLITIIISYYSIMFSIKSYKAIKHNKYVNLKDFIKNYTLIYLILSFVSILNSFIDVYFVSNILKFVV